MDFSWVYDHSNVDWDELSGLYRIAPLGEKFPADLLTVFSNSTFKCFVYANSTLVGVGRALADGADCSYICDVAVHFEYQGLGLGKKIIAKLVTLSEGHAKIILYANPGKEGFYSKLGFRKMTTAMAIFDNQKKAKLHEKLNQSDGICYFERKIDKVSSEIQNIINRSGLFTIYSKWCLATEKDLEISLCENKTKYFDVKEI